MRDEPLRRGQAPFLLPTEVRVAGQPSPRALAALAKRILYPPALWPDELDDRTSLSGAFSVTFAGELPGGGDAALLGRVRVKGPRLPKEATYGPVTLLGHNAGAKGWQPFVLALGQPLAPDVELDLRFDAPLSRLLLGRGGGFAGPQLPGDNPPQE